jgi:hypothetical protein
VRKFGLICDMAGLGARSRQPADVAHTVKTFCETPDGIKPRLSFLIGAGFSRSAGIPTAGEIVEQLKVHRHLLNAPPCPADRSLYGHLMGLLPAAERSAVIRSAIDRARRPDANVLQINWAHLFLARLVQAGYVKRILTTNFDPLIIDALSLLGLPAQAFDLTASQDFTPGMLMAGSVVYLHGQAHGLWLSNEPGEMDLIRVHVRGVLQDTLSDSTLVVVGYSGDCDHVFEELRTQRQFFHEMYWVHYDPRHGQVRAELEGLISRPGSGAYLVTDHDADSFMKALADSLGLADPLLIHNPLEHVLQALKRVPPYPLAGEKTLEDPVELALQRVQRAIAMDASYGRERDAPIAAVMSGDQMEVDQLPANGTGISASSSREALAHAYLERANDAVNAGAFDDAERALNEAQHLGTTDPWLPNFAPAA